MFDFCFYPTCYITVDVSIYDIEYERSNGKARRISTTVEFSTDKKNGMFSKPVIRIPMTLHLFNVAMNDFMLRVIYV